MRTPIPFPDLINKISYVTIINSGALILLHRLLYSPLPAIYRKMIPYCKELGVKLAIEMHHPHHPEVPFWKERRLVSLLPVPVKSVFMMETKAWKAARAMA